MTKIITNFNILPQDKDVSDDSNIKTLNKIIKTPKIEPTEVKIETKEEAPTLEPPETTESSEPAESTLTPPPPPEPVEPTLKLMRNHEGVVVGIEVICGCGERILIKMEYK